MVKGMALFLSPDVFQLYSAWITLYHSVILSQMLFWLEIHWDQQAFLEKKKKVNLLKVTVLDSYHLFSF